MFWLLCTGCALLTGCGEEHTEIGTLSIELLEGDTLTLSATNGDTIWLKATGVRDTSWPAEVTNLDGTGFAWSIKYDLTDAGPDPCFFLFEIHLPDRASAVPEALEVGSGPVVDPWHVWPALLCPAVVDGLLSGIDELKSASIKFVDGSLHLKPGQWPALVGNFEARIALHTYLSL